MKRKFKKHNNGLNKGLILMCRLQNNRFKIFYNKMRCAAAKEPISTFGHKLVSG